MDKYLYIGATLMLTACGQRLSMLQVVGLQAIVIGVTVSAVGA